MLVLDASVAVKWLVPEERQLEAEEILVSSIPLTAPAAIVAEVATALSKKVRVDGLSRQHARSSLRLWQGLLNVERRVMVVEDGELLSEALELSLGLNHQLPDCLYLALARHAQCPLVTADTQLVKKAKGLKGVEVRAL